MTDVVNSTGRESPVPASARSARLCAFTEPRSPAARPTRPPRPLAARPRTGQGHRVNHGGDKGVEPGTGKIPADIPSTPQTVLPSEVDRVR